MPDLDSNDTKEQGTIDGDSAGDQKPEPDGWDDFKGLIKDGKIHAKVDGKVQELGPSELMAQIQKGISADARFREASELSDRNKQALEVVSLIEKAKGGDKGATRELAKVLSGKTDEEIDQYMIKQQGSGDEDGEEEAPQLDPEVEEMKAHYQEQQRQTTREGIFSDVGDMVAKDPRFVKLVDTGVVENLDEVRALAKAFTRVSIGLDGDEAGPVAYGRVLDKVYKTLQSFGIQSDRGSLPTGAGPSPGPTEGVVVRPEKLMKRVSATEKGYEKYVHQQLSMAADDIRRGK